MHWKAKYDALTLTKLTVLANVWCQTNKLLKYLWLFSACGLSTHRKF